jgi:hypothetical protein
MRARRSATGALPRRRRPSHPDRGLRAWSSGYRTFHLLGVAFARSASANLALNAHIVFALASDSRPASDHARADVFDLVVFINPPPAW